jgi:hypothetical protein
MSRWQFIPLSITQLSVCAALQERLAALSKLLPEAAPKLPRVLLRSPFLLLRSPRAVARGIQGLSEALGLSCWAGSRLVAGQPGILRNNFDTLRDRWGAAV